jgi:hypothetical protein
MFALRDYLAVPASPVAADLSALRSRVFHFPGSTPDLRLPKDPSGLEGLLSGSHGSTAALTMTAPQGRVALTAEKGHRRAALLTGVVEGNDTALACVILNVVPPTARYGQPELVDVTMDIARGRDAQVRLLAAVWTESDPVARAEGAGSPAVWLGNDPGNPASALPEAVRGLGAAYGLDVEFVRDAHRRSREVAVRLAKAPPAYVLSWVPHATGCEAALKAYQAASEEGEVILLSERTETDVLLELGIYLDDLGLGEPAPPTARASAPPKSGAVRFYIKSYDSKVGDVMIEVPDCGHNKWGSDARRLAPRAYKGIWAQQGAAPVALFKCSQCSKNRWRARW